MTMNSQTIEKIDIREFWKQLYNNSKNKNIGYTDLIDFLEDNDWMNLEPEVVSKDGKKVVLISNESLKDTYARILTYLNTFQEPFPVRYRAITDAFADAYPKTSEYLINYLKNSNIDEETAFRLYEFLLAFQVDEIYKYSNDSMTALVETLCLQMTISDGNIIISFLSWLKDLRLTTYTKEFQLNSRNSESRVKEAYDSETYIRMIYTLFSEESIEKNHFYKRIAENKSAAVALLYLSLHMISALRDTDLVKLPHPRLLSSPHQILSLIRNNTIDSKTALVAVNQVLYNLNTFVPAPNKTKQYSNVSGIKLFIPESAMLHFGILFLAAEAHFQLVEKEEANYIYPIRDYKLIERYIGNEVADLLQEENFSARSANKSYMQVIESFGDVILEHDGPAHAKGYMLAALARSHKSSYGEFAKTTAIYLKDAAFSGYSVEFIAKELFERGVCSFIPSILLKMLMHDDYEGLPLHKQTEAIKTLGLSPGVIENTVAIVEDSIYDTAKTVNQTLSTMGKISDESFIRNTLQNIACGSAISKEYDCLCLMTALGKLCPYPERKQCIGCSYEISTKNTIYILVSEYKRLLKLKSKAGSRAQELKYAILLKKIILPSIKELFECMEMNYGHESVLELEEIIMEVTKDE